MEIFISCNNNSNKTIIERGILNYGLGILKFMASGKCN